jgi:hypothetical protein
MALDLEAFAKHAKRTTIGVEDVKLLARNKGAIVCHSHCSVCPLTSQTRAIEEMSEALLAADSASRAAKKAKKNGPAPAT